MREVKFKDGTTVVTPFLRVKHAAAFCGLSRTAFEDRAARVGLPSVGGKGLLLYKADILQAWVEGRLPEVPFTPAKEKRAAKKRPNRKRRRGEKIMALVDPVDGKAYHVKSEGVPVRVGVRLV
jgi:hypothetical protein